MNNTDRESAFPNSQDWPGYLNHLKGMTLRDYFAAKAMQAELSKNEIPSAGYDSLALRSYLIADAMLKERERNGQV